MAADRFASAAQLAQALQTVPTRGLAASATPAAPTTVGRVPRATRRGPRPAHSAVRRARPGARPSDRRAACSSPGGAATRRHRAAGERAPHRRAPLPEPGRLRRRLLRRRDHRRGARQAHRASRHAGHRLQQLGPVPEHHQDAAARSAASWAWTTCWSARCAGQKSAGGTSRVQVSPELIEVATADAKWQQPFDAALTDVFKVQADVAGKVAQALDVAIGSRQQQVLADRPTGQPGGLRRLPEGAGARAPSAPIPSTLRQAVDLYEQAVALDSGFVAAWAALSEAGSCLTATARPRPRWRTGRAPRPTGDRPRPDGTPTATARWATTTGSSRRHRPARSSSTPRASPSPRAMPTCCAASALAEQSLGQWDQSVEHLRRSQSLDPRAGRTPPACWAVRCSGSGATTRRWRRPIDALALAPSRCRRSRTRR